MEEDIPLEAEVISFIRANLYPQPNINESINLREMINMLNKVKADREIDLIQHGVDPDDWPDDEVLGQADDYINELIQKTEQQNIAFTKDVSLVTKKGRTKENANLPHISEILEKKIQSYGVEEPYNPKSEFEKVKILGGKSRKSRKIRRKSRKNKRKNERKTRKHRKHRKHRK